jgi:hypothetical protein
MGKINLNLSQAGAVLKKLSFLRSYSMLLLPLVIVIAAAAVFTTALLMGKSFRAKAAKQSIPIGQDIDSRLGSAVAAGQVEVEKRYQQQFEQDANEIEHLSIEGTKRELLDYGIFPEPNEPTSNLFTQFGHVFCSKTEAKVKGLNAADCPTEEELKASATKTAGVSRPTSDAERITEELCMQRARTAAVYINPVDIAGYNFWEDYKYTNAKDALKDCWDWQMGYWIIEDVLDTAGKMNEGSHSILDSPVKRIVYIGFASPDKMLTAAVGVTGRWQVTQDKPKYVIKTEDMLAEPCTGRMSTGDVDVVQFSVDAVVSIEWILPFMKELCSIKEHNFRGYDGKEAVKTYKHNQITILQNNIKPINVEDALHSRYRYGNQPAAEIELVCEYIFNKKGYEPIAPERATNAQQTAPKGK